MSDPECEKNEQTVRPVVIRVTGYGNLALLRELADEFLPPDAYEITDDPRIPADLALTAPGKGKTEDRDALKQQIFRFLEARTGVRPDWGVLTGVRPVKLAGEMLDSVGEAETRRYLKDVCYLTDAKIDRILSMARYQVRSCGRPGPGTIGVYIGIPFCPTRCLYCSFASNQVPDGEIERYLPALYQEIAFCGRKMRENGLRAESVYFGGGTPTTLNAGQLEELLGRTHEAFGRDFRELTVEAGRPDTITEEKLRVLKRAGVGRISINPQSMKQETLDRIGRSHTPEQIEYAFDAARRVGFPVVNSDLIAGLPGEDEADFEQTLGRVLALGANNVTIHTLAVKRASRLIDVDRNYHYRVAETVGRMLARADAALTENGFVPYYLYRQKHMAGWHENTGWCVPGTEGLYNVRIMDEHQSILALGAGGISKLYDASKNRLTRVPNVTNYSQYIDRIDEMCGRKEKGFFIEAGKEKA